MTRLDKSKPYGEIHGILPDGARYEQNGVRFNGAGYPVGTAPAVAVEEKEAPPAKPDQNTMILALHKAGKSDGEIAKELGIKSHWTVKAILKRVA